MIKNYKSKIKICIFAFIFLLIGELGLGMCFFQYYHKYDLYRRVVREYEIKKLGKIYLTTGTYQGKTDFGYFSGEGQFKFKTGVEYNGEWLNNEMSGVSYLKVPEEGEYEGEFSNSKKNGIGIYKWNDGTIYNGEWKNDKMDGSGKYSNKEGLFCEGTFKENSFYEGDCEFENATGTYRANFQNGKIENININFSDGTLYSGQCGTEWIEGNGDMTFPNGDTYTGDYLEGFRSGNGTYVWNTGEQYKGDWNVDKMDGQGIYTFQDGSYVSGEFSQNYFVSGECHLINDYGEFIFQITKDGEEKDVKINYSNGDVYEGAFSDGMKNGYGKYTWSDGSCYIGGWTYDKIQGKGEYYYASANDGYKITGLFEDGQPKGSCVYYLDRTKSYKTDWSEGKCVKVYE